jgi:hypothetical protein
MKYKSFLALACWTVATICAMAQVPADTAKLAVQVSENREENRKKLRDYSWKTRTEITIKGETKLLKVELVRFDVDGRMQKTTLSEEKPDRRKKRGVRGRIQKHKIEEKKEWFGELHGLLRQYSLPTTGKVLDFLEKATFGPGDRPGTIRIRGTSVVKPGDELTMWIDADTKETKLTKVRTRLDGDTVLFETNHDSLASGLRYQARSIIKVPAADVRMTVENFDYNRQ